MQSSHAPFSINVASGQDVDSDVRVEYLRPTDPGWRGRGCGTVSELLKGESRQICARAVVDFFYKNLSKQLGGRHTRQRRSGRRWPVLTWVGSAGGSNEGAAKELPREMCSKRWHNVSSIGSSAFWPALHLTDCETDCESSRCRSRHFRHKRLPRRGGRLRKERSSRCLQATAER